MRSPVLYGNCGTPSRFGSRVRNRPIGFGFFAWLCVGLPVRLVSLVAFETILIVSAVGAAEYVQFGDKAWEVFLYDNGLVRALIIAAVSQACLYYADMYDLRLIISDRRELFVRILHALTSASFLLALLYFRFPSLVIGRGVFPLAALLVIALVIGWRIAFDWLSRRVRPRERLLIVGTSSAALKLARELFDRRHELGLQIVGFIDPNPGKGSTAISPGVVGTIEDIPSIVRTRAVDRVIISLSEGPDRLPMEKLLEMKLEGVSFDHLASVYEDYTGKVALENLRPSWLIFSRGFQVTLMLSASKRMLDLALSSIGLIVAAPLMALIVVAIKLTSSGPVLCHQTRVGRHGRIFTIHRFQSMRPNVEARIASPWSKGDVVGVTPLSVWLRRTGLNELPQLWNVFVGDMSLVGPRPERPAFVAELTREIPYYWQRHMVRPGLTGWAQVCYTFGATTEDALEKLQYNLHVHQEPVASTRCVYRTSSLQSSTRSRPTVTRLGGNPTRCKLRTTPRLKLRDGARRVTTGPHVSAYARCVPQKAAGHRDARGNQVLSGTLLARHKRPRGKRLARIECRCSREIRGASRRNQRDHALTTGSRAQTLPGAVSFGPLSRLE